MELSPVPLVPPEPFTPSIVGLRFGEGETFADGVERPQQPTAAPGVALASVDDITCAGAGAAVLVGVIGGASQ